MRLFAALLLALAAPAAALSQPETEASVPTSTDLIGTWDVALYFAPDQPPSSTVMTISAVEDGALTGTFYGSDMSVGRVTVFEGEVLFTAVTEDGTGPYLHSGRLHGEVIAGQTLSTGRNFLMAWKATRKDGSAE